ncbi:unnamed protein product [Owenia fusiformis]|uniref:Uncharacterized protein n=1 Tax=Owenia fusiformis TaxID=6347 RepID=A0A8J1TZL4_OWEFU|nr:unnamed protein product [Owenia fusiformis]
MGSPFISKLGLMVAILWLKQTGCEASTVTMVNLSLPLINSTHSASNLSTNVSLATIHGDNRSTSEDVSPVTTNGMIVDTDLIDHGHICPYDKPFKGPDNCSIGYDMVDSLKDKLITPSIEVEWPCELLHFWSDFKPFVNFVKGLLSYGTSIIVAVGLVFNALSFRVFIHPDMSSTSSHIYLAALAVFDSLVLIFNFMIGVLRGQNPNTVNKSFQSSEGLCRVHSVVIELFNLLSVWMIVCFTVERFISVTFPFKVVTLCTVKRARRVIIGVSILVFIISCHKIFISGFEGDSVFGYQACRKNTFKFGEAIYFYVGFNTWLPAITILVINVAIIVRLRKQSTKRRQLTQVGKSKTDEKAVENREARVTRLLLIVSFTYFFLILPLGLVQSVELVYNKVYKVPQSNIEPQKSEYVHYQTNKFRLKWTRAFFFFFYQINFCVNFVLYVGTNLKFRATLSKILPFCNNDSSHENKEKSSTITRNTEFGNSAIRKRSNENVHVLNASNLGKINDGRMAQIQRLLWTDEYTDFDDNILIESPFVQVTPSGKGLKQLYVGLTQDAIIMAVHNLSRGQDTHEQMFIDGNTTDPELDFIELNKIIPLACVRINIDNDPGKRIVVELCSGEPVYLELSEKHNREQIWDEWYDQIAALNSPYRFCSIDLGEEPLRLYRHTEAPDGFIRVRFGNGDHSSGDESSAPGSRRNSLPGLNVGLARRSSSHNGLGTPDSPLHYSGVISPLATAYLQGRNFLSPHRKDSKESQNSNVSRERKVSVIPEETQKSEKSDDTHSSCTVSISDIVPAKDIDSMSVCSDMINVNNVDKARIVESDDASDNKEKTRYLNSDTAIADSKRSSRRSGISHFMMMFGRLNSSDKKLSEPHSHVKDKNKENETAEKNNEEGSEKQEYQSPKPKRKLSFLRRISFTNGKRSKKDKPKGPDSPTNVNSESASPAIIEPVINNAADNLSCNSDKDSGYQQSEYLGAEGRPSPVDPFGFGHVLEAGRLDITNMQYNPPISTHEHNRSEGPGVLEGANGVPHRRIIHVDSLDDFESIPEPDSNFIDIPIEVAEDLINERQQILMSRSPSPHRDRKSSMESTEHVSFENMNTTPRLEWMNRQRSSSIDMLPERPRSRPTSPLVGRRISHEMNQNANPRFKVLQRMNKMYSSMEDIARMNNLRQVVHDAQVTKGSLDAIDRNEWSLVKSDVDRWVAIHAKSPKIVRKRSKSMARKLGMVGSSLVDEQSSQCSSTASLTDVSAMEEDNTKDEIFVAYETIAPDTSYAGVVDQVQMNAGNVTQTQQTIGTEEKHHLSANSVDIIVTGCDTHELDMLVKQNEDPNSNTNAAKCSAIHKSGPKLSLIEKIKRKRKQKKLKSLSTNDLSVTAPKSPQHTNASIESAQYHNNSFEHKGGISLQKNWSINVTNTKVNDSADHDKEGPVKKRLSQIINRPRSKSKSKKEANESKVHKKSITKSNNSVEDQMKNGNNNESDDDIDKEVRKYKTSLTGSIPNITTGSHSPKTQRSPRLLKHKLSKATRKISVMDALMKGVHRTSGHDDASPFYDANYAIPYAYDPVVFEKCKALQNNSRRKSTMHHIPAGNDGGTTQPVGIYEEYIAIDTPVGDKASAVAPDRPPHFLGLQPENTTRNYVIKKVLARGIETDSSDSE